MVALDDLELLLGKLYEMEELGHILGVEEELQQFRGAIVRQARATEFDDDSLWQLGAINERADELLEKIWCWHERSRSGSTASLTVKLADVIACFFNKIKFRPTIASELKKLTSDYQRMALPIRTHGTSPAAFQLIGTHGIVGREEDVHKIITRIDQPQQWAEEGYRKLRVIPIVGMPGIGKTTVAQMVYAHPSVEHRFNMRIWVHVSQYFDHETVLRRMANFLRGTNSPDGDENSIHDILKEELRWRRYLLVLDDVWNENHREWDALKQQLLDISAAAEAQGTVIVTTSRHSVAEMMAVDTVPPYELQGLSAADCLRLFHQMLHEKELQFPQEEEERVHEVIREKCCASPLAVIDLAKFLTEKFIHEGLNAFRPYLAALDGNCFQDLFSRRLEIYKSLLRRFELLPIHLRHCFRFCSLFPEDRNYDMEELGEMWLAQRWNAAAADMLQPHPELTCYAELRKGCFYQNSEHYSTDKVTHKMHCLMRQFADYINSRDWKYLNRRSRGLFAMLRMRDMLDPPHDPRKWFHLSLLVDSEISAFPMDLPSFKNLKTLILLRATPMVLSSSRCKISTIAPELLASMKNLCVLDLQYTMIKKVPFAVGNLRNLRYLNLSGTDITSLPSCIGRLQSLMFLKLVNCVYLRRLNDVIAGLVNLQKLDIAGCVSLVRIPNRIDNMKQLRCMNIKDCSSMVQMPYSLGKFTTLHTLPRYIVGENDGYTIKELQTLRLEDELRIDNLQKVAGGIDAATAELRNKTMLKSLTLQWKWWKHEDEAKDTEAIQEVLEELEPNNDLIKLEIISFMGKQFPKWMSRMPPYLASLEEIRLFNLKRCQELPPLGVLPRLRVAEISGMDAITNVDDAFYGADGTFPSLQKLTFSQMLKLEKWSDVKRRNMFPCLTNLLIINCPQMMALEMELPSVTELAMWLNNERLYSSKGGLKGLAGSLKKLSISLCEKLLESSECEGLQELRVLEEMEMSGCQELTSLPIGIRHLNSIKSLTITCCNKLTASPSWSNDELTSLRSLYINGWNLLG